ncbi:MAG: type IV toxin-antitoxin system AbiEi family antitoxin domain-containing protein [Bifidobacteriaceae bacterium]|nr:type IV toxin-antitoxin system AbiEi family antitoxin domain-containing protein [Bifidobacteriaceae bacterium]
MPGVLTQLERLREVALDQHGFVTSAQAEAEGVPRVELVKLAARDRIERVARGVYRIPQVPASRFDNWALAVLWTGAPEACLSHETALAAWDVSGVNPDQIHVTVGKRRRLRRAGGERYAIHHQDLGPDQRTWFEQIPVTDVPTTISQCIETGVPSYLVRQALERAGGTSLLLAGERERLAQRLEERDHGKREAPQPRRGARGVETEGEGPALGQCPERLDRESRTGPGFGRGPVGVAGRDHRRGGGSSAGAGRGRESAFPAEGRHVAAAPSARPGPRDRRP